MNNFEYDVIIIGGGTAGLGAYRTIKAMGKKVLIIEKGEFVTTCANVGCMPSKLLIAAAENMHEIKTSSQFGINVGNISVDSKKLLKRVRAERDRFVGFVKSGADKIPEKDKVIGLAKFLDKNTIEVNHIKYTANAFVIATGSRVSYLPVFSGLEDELLTNESIFEIEDIPSSMAVFGAGVIGLELGFAFHHLETEITMFNRSKRLLKLNSEINQYLTNHIKSCFEFETDNLVEKIEKITIGNKVNYKLYFGDKTKVVEKILVAVGRKPNIDNLGLENHSKDLGIYNSLTTQLGKSNLFLAGDVNTDLSLLHVAAKEGSIAAKNAVNFPHVKNREYTNVPLSIVFSSPQIMQVGKTVDLPDDVIKGQVSFEDQGRSRVMLKNKGMLNVYFDSTNHYLIGAEMIGPNAENIAHLLAWQIEQNASLEQLLEMPFYHPVVEEGVRTAFRDAASKINL